MDHLEVVVGMRLHFLIFAAIAGVPFLALPYAGKVFDFVDAVGVPAPVDAESSSAGLLLAALDRLWDTRDQHRDRLRNSVPGLQDRARHTAELALSLLENASRPDAG